MEPNAEFKKWDILDIIFEGRNKAYGAYLLRRIYPSHIRKALIAGVLLFAFFMTIPYWLKYIKLGKDEDKKENVEIKLKDLTPPPEKEDEVKPPPPPPPKKVEPPKPPQQQFTPPVIKKDEEVKKEPPKIEEITTNTGTETVKGDDKGYVPQIDEPVVQTAVDPDEGKVFSFVEQTPTFPGGDAALMDFLRKNIKYPPIARENGVEGRVLISFVVDKNGNIRDITVKRGIGSGCDEEAIRVVKMMPDWKPGKQNGKSVNVMYNLPISFKLQ
ncbi:MAG: TonB family protein [Saprospiraceae bacterium]|jgi:protein TonB|nr:TonB family protein [Saprospiraceae bacterium]